MKRPYIISLKTRDSERGQTMMLVLLILSIFLIAAAAFAVDVANLWFHRQTAQDAADAACAAGAMDILTLAQGVTPPGLAPNFKPGSKFDCGVTFPNTAIATTPVPCWYAATNGYPSPSLLNPIKTNTGSPSNNVFVSFPVSVSGITTSTELFPTQAAFMQVNVIDRVKVFLMGLLSGKRTEAVSAVAICGGVVAEGAIPILVLHPSASGALSLGGTINIYGGPTRGIQVNSSSSSAASGGGNLDLSQGGPTLTGSDVGVFGGPSAACCGFNGGTTGSWVTPAAPILDPLAHLAAPAQPLSGGAGFSKDGVAVMGGTNGCPENMPTTCQEYVPGYYQNGIDVNGTAIFDPGLYYVLNGFSMRANSCVWPSTAIGDGSGGTIFYFADTSSVSVGSNAGKNCPATAFNMTSGTGSLPYGVKCTATSSVPGNLPAMTTGNILLAPCRLPTIAALCAPNCSINYGDQLGGTGPGGEQRGILFFQNRSKVASPDPDWSSGGQFLLAGTMYFHQCVTTGSDTGMICSPTAYNTSLSFGGNSGSGNYIVGEVIADKLVMVGTITMDLTSSASGSVRKVSLLR